MGELQERAMKLVCDDNAPYQSIKSQRPQCGLWEHLEVMEWFGEYSDQIRTEGSSGKENVNRTDYQTA